MKKYLIFIALLISMPALFAQVPMLVNYQGKLDSAGVPISGTRNLTFNIYSVATAGTALWTETQSGVTITNGIFNVLLGSVTTFPAAVFGGTGERYLGITVGTGPEMTPRFRITSSAFSIRAASADGVADNSITSPKIVDGTITSADIATGAVGSTQIADGAVTAVDLASNSVTTVKIADGAVNAAKVADEPGVVQIASLPMNTFRSIPSGINALDSITITIPAAGYVHVFVNLTTCISHTNGATDEIYFQIMDSRNVVSYYQTGFGMVRLPAELPTNSNYWYPIHLTRIFTETTAGTYTYYINSRVLYGWDASDRFFNLHLSAVYYRTAYGTVSLSKSEGEVSNSAAGE